MGGTGLRFTSPVLPYTVEREPLEVGMRRNMSNWILVFVFAIGLIGCDSGGSSNTGGNNNAINVVSADKPNSIDEIINDMKLSHEGIPHGVPISYDWYSNPVVHNALPFASFSSPTITNWGQFYEDSYGNLASNTRVQIRSIKTYYLSRQSNQWSELQIVSPIDGAWYPENFVGSSVTANNRNEVEGISATAGNGYCFHFWKRDRSAINSSDIAGVFITIEARLIENNSNLPDDRASARYLLSAGADYWSDNSPSATNSSIGTGRFKYVRTGWQHFNFTTVSESNLRSNPPPVQ